MTHKHSSYLARLTLCLGAWGASACDDGDTTLTRQTLEDLDAVCAAAAGPTLTAKAIQLWPPNHKFHSVSVEDCAGLVDACDPDLRAEFVWASSDEPVDDRGDGHHAPDILFDDCHRVQVRAERQGPKDGRVYKLGVRVVDRAGHSAETACTIIVDHDQRGVVGADSGESYRLQLNGQDGLPSCDGTPDVPPVTPTPDAGAPSPDAGTPPPVVPPTPDAGTPPPFEPPIGI
jgi:hypothetical protein